MVIAQLDRMPERVDLHGYSLDWMRAMVVHFEAVLFDRSAKLG